MIAKLPSKSLFLLHYKFGKLNAIDIVLLAVFLLSVRFVRRCSLPVGSQLIGMQSETLFLPVLFWNQRNRSLNVIDIVLGAVLTAFYPFEAINLL